MQIFFLDGKAVECVVDRIDCLSHLETVEVLQPSKISQRRSMTEISILPLNYLLIWDLTSGLFCSNCCEVNRK